MSLVHESERRNTGDKQAVKISGRALLLLRDFRPKTCSTWTGKRKIQGWRIWLEGEKKSTFAVVQEKKARQKEPGRKKRLAEKGDS